MDANSHLLAHKIEEPLLAKLIQSDMSVLHNSFVPAVDKACRELWLSGGNAITSAFIRNELVPRVLAAIDDREAEIRQSLELRFILVGARNDQCFPFMLKHLSREMPKLKKYVENHYRIEIGQFKRQESRRNHPTGKRKLHLSRPKQTRTHRRVLTERTARRVVFRSSHEPYEKP